MYSDEQIIKMIQNGRVDCFRKIISRYQNNILRICTGVLGNKEDAEDAAQETFLRAFQNLSQYEKSGSFWPWIRKIAIHICLRRLSTRKRFEDIDEYSEMLTTSSNPVLNEVLANMKSADIRKIVTDLPDIYRTVIVLRYSEELSVKEISEAIGETATTVHIRLHRAKKLLRERMV